MTKKRRPKAGSDARGENDYAARLGRFYQRYRERLLQISGKCGRADRAEDAVQTLMEHFLARPLHWEQIEDERYLCGALRNRQADRRREEARQRRRVRNLLSVTPEGAPLQEPSAEDCAATAEDLEAELAKLGDDPRLLCVFRLLEIEGLTAEQAGHRMGLSRHQVNRLIKTPAYQAIVAKYTSVAPSHPDRSLSKARRRRKSSTLLTAIIALSMALIPMQVGRELGREPSTIVTRANEYEARTLGDGSTVEVAPDTVLTVNFRPTQRLIDLTSGQATFDVTHDAQRPFVVRTETLQAEAIGTRFTVRCDDAGCEALVAEGIVEVTPRSSEQGVIVQLRAGQQVNVPKERIKDGLASTGLGVREDGWETFSDVTVGELVAKFNQRHAIQIHVDSPAIAATRIGSGRVRMDSVESFGRWLTHYTGATLIRGFNDEWILTSGPTPRDGSSSAQAAPK